MVRLTYRSRNRAELDLLGDFAVQPVYLINGMINLTISGYQGQDGRTAFLSSEAGNKDYNGSLAVKDIEDRTCRFTVQNL